MHEKFGSQGWGNYPSHSPAEILELDWRHERIPFANYDATFLCRGQGRSYGDSCLNENGILIATHRLNRFISFDAEQGEIECEAGMILADILEFVLPRCWCLPVLPGTQFVSVGGAIANDIHGKNHHATGSFGAQVISFALLRSNGEKIICSPRLNSELYRATIGGLGLTGVILSAKLKLRRITSQFLAVEHIPFKGLQHFVDLAIAAEKKYEYTVAWLDCLARKNNFGRGIFMRANHCVNEKVNETAIFETNTSAKLSLPWYLPKNILNKWSITAFNHWYFHRQSAKQDVATLPLKKFFFPLDAINNWNRLYGRSGFLQYQFVLPLNFAARLLEILKIIGSSGQSPFLSVLKTFGECSSPGILSFPMRGVTLAFDLPFKGIATLELLNKIDAIVMECGGRVYPAKDARMSAAAFKHFFPNYREFLPWLDPKFSSSFWRRVTQDET